METTTDKNCVHEMINERDEILVDWATSRKYKNSVSEEIGDELGKVETA